MSNSSTIHAIDPSVEPDRGRPVRRRGVVSLGRWGGIPVAAHWSSLFTLALFGEILATSVLPSARPGSAALGYWLVGFASAAVFLCTLLVHEFAHALTARRHGVGVKGITLWMLGGVTELDGDMPSPRADGLIAAAGPSVCTVAPAATLPYTKLVRLPALASSMTVMRTRRQNPSRA